MFEVEEEGKTCLVVFVKCPLENPLDAFDVFEWWLILNVWWLGTRHPTPPHIWQHSTAEKRVEAQV